MSNDLHIPIDGSCDPQFIGVNDTFGKNFHYNEDNCYEIGAAVCIYYKGKKVVDLWGGYRDRQSTKPWKRDTITTMMSVTKSVVTVCALMLIDRNLIALNKPVAHYWPEFLNAGKENILVEQLLSSQSGVIYADAAPANSLWQDNVVIRALEQQTPAWPPGEKSSYHSFTYGILLGELISRVDGRSIADFFHEEIAIPLNLDFHIGLPESDLARCADYVTTPGTPSLEGIQGRDTASPLFRAWRPLPNHEDFNSHEWRTLQMPSANGHGNPRAIAKLYACLANGGELDGVRLLSQELLNKARQPYWTGIDFMLNRPVSFGLGFWLHCDSFKMGGKINNFGHPGLGGSIGFADPDNQIAFSYCPNRMSPITDMGPFASNLVTAMYESL